MHVLNTVLAYRIYDIREIEPHQVEILKIQDDRDLMTLVTCTPYGVNTERLLVMGERIPVEELELDEDGDVIIEGHEVVIDPAVWVFIGFMTFIFLIFFSTLIRNIIYYRKKKKGDKE